MLKKLKSDLRNPILRSAFRAGFISLLLFWAGQSRSFAAVIAYLASALYFYFSPRPGDGAGKLLFSFLIVSTSSILIIIHDSFFIIPIIFGFFFFVVFGLKDSAFKNNRIIYQIFNNFSLFFVFIVLFFIDKSRFFLIKYIGSFLAAFFLIREFLIWQFGKIGKINLFAVVMSFLVFQLAWAIMFLPIGFLNSAAMMLVIVLVFKDLISAYFNKTLNQRLIMKNITIVAISSLIIFMASRWQP